MTNFDNYAFYTAKEIVDQVLTDTYDDGGVLEERCYHWLYRVWTDLTKDMFRQERNVILPVSPGTQTVTLPHDYLNYIFIGYIDDCHRLQPIAHNMNLAPRRGISDQRVICRTCGTEDLSCTLGTEEVTEAVLIGTETYQKVITRVLHKNGAYVQETIEPVAVYTPGVETPVIEMKTTTQMLCNLPVKECGCVDPSKTNLLTLCDCGSINAFTCCGGSGFFNSREGATSYNIYKNEGFIQLNPNNCLEHIYLSYIGGGLCRSGKFYFPEAAAEALIAGVYLKSIQKKRGMLQWVVRDAERAYSREKKIAFRGEGKMNIQEVVEIFSMPPRIAAG